MATSDPTPGNHLRCQFGRLPTDHWARDEFEEPFPGLGVEPHVRGLPRIPPPDIIVPAVDRDQPAGVDLPYDRILRQLLTEARLLPQARFLDRIRLDFRTLYRSRRW